MDLQAFRMKRLTETAKNYGFDCLVASSPQNLRYLCDGYAPIGKLVSAASQYYAVFSVSNQKVIYVTSMADAENFLEHGGHHASIYAYGSFYLDYSDSHADYVKTIRKIEAARYMDPIEALTAAVKDSGSSPAFDEVGISFPLSHKIQDALGIDKLFPANQIFMEARKIKHPDEIKALAKSAQIAESALLKTLDGITPGMTEAALEKNYRLAVTEQGADPYFFVATTKYRASHVDAYNTDLAFGDGDMIRFDFGCIYQGFYSDLARTAVIHSANHEIQTAYTAVREGTKAALALLRPGISPEEIFHAAVNATKANGLPRYARTHCGHGIGLEGYDFPSVAVGIKEAISENMVINIETPYYRVGWGGVQIEHTVATTRNGYVFLDSGNSDLIIVP